jgi:hypothetical protein
MDNVWSRSGMFIGTFVCGWATLKLAPGISLWIDQLSWETKITFLGTTILFLRLLYESKFYK